MRRYGGNIVKPPINNAYLIPSKMASLPSAKELIKPMNTTMNTTDKTNASNVAKKLCKINFPLLINF